MKREPIKRTHAQPGDIIAVHRKLTDVLKPDGDRWAYAPGYDDAKIAEELAIKVSSVVNLRRKLFGDLKVRAGSGRSERYGDLAQRLAALEERMRTVEEIIAPTKQAAE